MEYFTDNLTAGNVKAAMNEADPGFAGLSKDVWGILAELLGGVKKPE